jgi:hypothetical protein
VAIGEGAFGLRCFATAPHQKKEMLMHCGLFMMPLHPPEQDPTQAYDEDLELLVRADELGYSEAWIGEHFTTGWENIIAPDLFIAKALPLMQKRCCRACGISKCPGAREQIASRRYSASAGAQSVGKRGSSWHRC